ncbi:MAG: SDR family NAD(P)-dependent oxidoreductase [Candidatus Binatia bacterium]
MRIEGSTVLLTGATGGIGHAIARALGKRGAKLVLTGRKKEPLAALAEELSARTIAAELADPASIDQFVAEAGTVDALVANAALPATGPVLEFAPADVDRLLAVNLRSPIVLSAALAKGMVERKRGAIVLIGSLASKTASPGGAMYSATKFGLRGFAHGFRADLHGSGVGVSIVLPGFIREAGMFADAKVELPAGVRTSSPEEVAAAVVRAIEEDVGEITVAPVEMKVMTTIATVAPMMSAALQRLAGGDRLSRELAAGQRDKR